MLFASDVDISMLSAPIETIDGTEYWTGKQIFSTLLPKDLNIDYKSKVCRKCEHCEEAACKYDAFVHIRNGQLLNGVIDGATFKARSTCKLLDKLVKDYGTDTGRSFLDSVTRMILMSNAIIGFTTGIDDEDLPKPGLDNIEKNLKEGKKKVDGLIQAYNDGYLEPLPGRTAEETLESKIMQALATARDDAGNSAERYLGLDRGAVIMAKTGAKGNCTGATSTGRSRHSRKTT
jgi:DNA-directed RNA polymerase subunit A'